MSYTRARPFPPSNPARFRLKSAGFCGECRIRTYEGVKPTDLQSVPVDRLGNSPMPMPASPRGPKGRTPSAKPLAGENEPPSRASEGTRTLNLLITNQLLCQLSYAGLQQTASRRGENQLI